MWMYLLNQIFTKYSRELHYSWETDNTQNTYVCTSQVRLWLTLTVNETENGKMDH